MKLQPRNSSFVQFVSEGELRNPSIKNPTLAQSEGLKELKDAMAEHQSMTNARFLQLQGTLDMMAKGKAA